MGKYTFSCASGAENVKKNLRIFGSRQHYPHSGPFKKTPLGLYGRSQSRLNNFLTTVFWRLGQKHTECPTLEKPLACDLAFRLCLSELNSFLNTGREANPFQIQVRLDGECLFLLIRLPPAAHEVKRP